MSERAFTTQTGGLVSKGQDELMLELAVMARGRKEAATDGPIRLGSSATIAETIGVEGLAAYYQHSFETSRRAFPYFGDLKERR
jgi:hypothetical protein